jgi:hypothetical protein
VIPVRRAAVDGVSRGWASLKASMILIPFSSPAIQSRLFSGGLSVLPALIAPPNRAIIAHIWAIIAHYNPSIN